MMPVSRTIKMLRRCDIEMNCLWGKTEITFTTTKEYVVGKARSKN